MPTRPATICRHPACGAIATDHGLCAAHQSDRMQARRIWQKTTLQASPELLAAKRLRDSREWQKLRQYHKDLNPLCCDPFKEHGRFPPMTQHSHHIIPLIEDISQGLVYDNLAPLCTSCHNRIEGMERSGKDTKGLFKGWKNAEINLTF